MREECRLSLSFEAGRSVLFLSSIALYRLLFRGRLPYALYPASHSFHSICPVRRSEPAKLRSSELGVRRACASTQSLTLMREQERPKKRRSEQLHFCDLT